jgi:hypothetical protein
MLSIAAQLDGVDASDAGVARLFELNEWLDTLREERRSDGREPFTR